MIDATYRLSNEKNVLDVPVYFAGQITGVEGYMESAASGIMAGKNAVRALRGEAPLCLPKETMIGALTGYISDPTVTDFQPMGANMGILRVDHPDIEEFIRCKKNNSDITNFNISVGLTEAFMQAVEKNEDYDLIDPRTKEPCGKRSARKLFDEIVEAE